MIAKTYSVTLTGETPLLMHHDNLDWAEKMEEWKNDPDNKGAGKAGDDRTPAYRWIGCLYTEDNKIVIPSDNIMTLLREGGKRCLTGKGKGTFKSQTQSGIVVDQASWPLIVSGKTIDMKRICPLVGDRSVSFEQHQKLASELGFMIWPKRAKIGNAKHVRVRPRFDNWSISGTVTVLDEQITDRVVSDIFRLAGTYCGLCDWRPSSPMAPGPFGKFTSKISAI